MNGEESTAAGWVWLPPRRLGPGWRRKWCSATCRREAERHRRPSVVRGQCGSHCLLASATPTPPDARLGPDLLQVDVVTPRCVHLDARSSTRHRGRAAACSEAGAP